MEIHGNIHVYMFMKARKHARFHLFSASHYIIMVKGLLDLMLVNSLFSWPTKIKKGY